MVADSHRASDRSNDRRARRSRRSRSRSTSNSRPRRSSHHRSSKRRSVSRSHSRERSRRSSRHRHSHRRARSRSRDHHKRRRHSSKEKKGKRRSHSGERHKKHHRSSDEKRIKHSSPLKVKAASKADEKHQNDKNVTVLTSTQLSKSKVVEVRKNAKKAEDKSMDDKSTDKERSIDKLESQQKMTLTQTVSQTTVLNSKNSGSPYVEETQAVKLIDAISIIKPEPTTPKPAVDVQSIKADILKALADARSTIAVIKKNGASSSVVTTPTTSVVIESKEVEVPVKVSKEQLSEVIASPKETILSPVKRVFATDNFDMFSMAALDEHAVSMNCEDVASVTVNEVALQSNCDDAEGYYNAIIGEILDGKYRVLGVVGKGVFSTVLRCQCITPLKFGNNKSSLNVVAIKLIRNHDVMRDAAQTELRLLKELGERDLGDKKHCIKLFDSFTHRNHVALVFEPMEMNVREAMKKFGGKGGISIQAVRVFSKHLLIALNHLESCCIIHADIKPDNMLLDAKQTTIKLCDFGSAFKMDEGKQDPTPYLVSRFYRAPEIVLGLTYDKAVDMWSVGCCLYEMFTGKVLFPGSTNNELLKFFMELKGKIPNKLIKKHRQAYIEQFGMEPHFTEDLKFCSRESDRITGKPLLRFMDTMKIKNDLGNNLLAAKSTTDDRKHVLELRNLLDKMFMLDPMKRISVKEALAHPFVRGSLASTS